MKIYYIANARIPTERAHGIQLAKMVEAMIKSGADIELVLPNRKNPLVSTKEYYGLSLEIPFTKLPIIDVYNKGSVGFIFGSFTFMCSYLFWLLWKKIKGEKFVIYTIDMDQFSFAFIPIIGVPFFAEIHDAKAHGIAYSFFFRYVKGLVVINALIKAKMIERFRISSDRIVVYSNAIDLDFFRVSDSQIKIRERLGLPLDKKIILYSGKMYGWKGFEILVKAGEMLPSGMLVYIVGGTKEELVSVSSALSTKTSESIVCVGQKGYTDIPLWLHAADAFVVLGTKENEYSYYHTSPMKLYEYMSAERVVVASRTPAIQQMVTENEVVFYTPDDVQSLADAMIDVLLNPLRYEDRVKKSVQKIQGLTWKKRAGNVLSFIDQILKK